MRTKYFYTRDYNNKITATYGLLIDSDSLVYVARAFVHPNEQAEKRIGRTIVDNDIRMLKESNLGSTSTVLYEHFGERMDWASMVFSARDFNLVDGHFNTEVGDWIFHNIWRSYNV